MITNLTNALVWAAEDVYLDESGEVMIGVEQGRSTQHGKVVTMERSSGGTKTDDTVSIFMLQFHVDLCRMYRDIKAQFFCGERSARVGMKYTSDPIVNGFYTAAWQGGVRRKPAVFPHSFWGSSRSVQGNVQDVFGDRRPPEGIRQHSEEGRNHQPQGGPCDGSQGACCDGPHKEDSGHVLRSGKD